jgi:sugar (pentulose or hexulose) kinase
LIKPIGLQADLPLFLGIDLGTSGARACVIDSDTNVRTLQLVRLPVPDTPCAGGFEQHPRLWWQAVTRLLEGIARCLPMEYIASIAVDGTSGSVLLTDGAGNPTGSALMYRDSRATKEARQVCELAPVDCAAHGPSSGLSKLLWLTAHGGHGYSHVLNQADWLMGRLAGRYGFSDENNCLKLGYDPLRRRWPEWISSLVANPECLPRVYPAGKAILSIDPDLADRFGFSQRATIVTGTTDSIAAMLATGACETGDAVTSLGSTLVLKVIADRPIVEPRFGIYSHRLGARWLAGGASNSGGAVLRQFFTEEDLRTMTPRLNPQQPTGLGYYPLPAPGERFPLADPRLPPRLSPRPHDPVRFFQGILEGIAEIEAQGYRKLQELGAPYPRSVRTVGGGAINVQWGRIRELRLGVELLSAAHHEAAYGAALLAREGFNTRDE